MLKRDIFVLIRPRVIENRVIKLLLLLLLLLLALARYLHTEIALRKFVLYKQRLPSHQSRYSELA
jgi:hypothetical protein